MAHENEHYDLSLRLKDLPPFEELTCLDLGCGNYDSEVAKQVLDLPWKRLVSVDCYEPDLLKAETKTSKAAHWMNIVDDVRSFAKDRPTEKSDVVLSFDTLEHLTKEDGIEWLKNLDHLANKRIVLFFPNEPEGFHRVSPDPANPAQEHISHWRSDELIPFGYKVHELSDCHSETRPDGSIIRFGATWAIKDL